MILKKDGWYYYHSKSHPYWKEYWKVVFHSLRCRSCRNMLSGVFVQNR